MTTKDAIARELKSLRKGIDKLRAEMKAAAMASVAGPVAVNRKAAARMMGIGESKLDSLVKAKKVRTAEDVRLIPMSEVRRYCAPKVARQRKPMVGHRARNRHEDGQSDEAIAEMKRELREQKRAAGSST